MTDATLSTEHSHEHAGPYPFDRRCSPRWSAEGVATAFVLGGECFGAIHGLDALDFGYYGMGARVARPVTPGSIVTIGFSSTHHAARRGVVTRCVPVGDGYRVGISFEGRLAA